MNTKLAAFAESVKEMRQAQKAYLALRRQRTGPEEYGPALKEARKLEAVVDGWIRAIEAQEGQGALFE